MQTRPTLVPREIEKYDTENCSLRQGDEEVKQKYIYFDKFAQYFGLKTNLPQGLEENEDKTKSSLQIRVWRYDNKNNGFLLI